MGVTIKSVKNPLSEQENTLQIQINIITSKDVQNIFPQSYLSRVALKNHTMNYSVMHSVNFCTDLLRIYSISGFQETYIIVD